MYCATKRHGFTDSLLTFSKLLEQSDTSNYSHVLCALGLIIVYFMCSERTIHSYRYVFAT